ncbi:hypothetical protein [Halobaculum gomorrense]|uniref:RNA ligase domain-containing protein n=1 Tax=Halobaculum gomorrense TaxID=43928 RepID=A0A1M5UYR8_9EURY|nr:hypothetical protein [Halobaculum gomorrense]SHH68197.1 hypothetical protein SAMN05443636_3185 [Halobaculum gomorrense]
MSDPPADEIAPPRLRTVGEEFLETGHVWLYEYPDGTPFEARLDADSRLQVAFAAGAQSSDQPRRWVDAEEAPSEFGFAVRTLTTQLDRRALRRAVDDPTAVRLRCIAVHRRHRGYDWSRAPPVVGVDVAYPGSELLPHELERAFEEFGVATMPILDTEVHVRDIELPGEAPPETQWGEGTAYGVLYRKKGGGVARAIAGEYAGEPPAVEPIRSAVAEYAATVASDDVLASFVQECDSSPSVSTVTDAVVDQALRAEFGRLTHSGTAFDIEDLRSALPQRVAAFL